MNKYLTVFFVMCLFVQLANGQESITEVFNSIPFENLSVSLCSDSFENFIVTERWANISEGEIYWIKENIDTISIKCVKQEDGIVDYFVNESHDDWMGLMYDSSIEHLLPKKYNFPTIQYSKNSISKIGFYPDSCHITDVITFHLSQRVELYKMTNSTRFVGTFEKLIRKIENCKLGRYNVLMNSRHLIALDNYLVPINFDTLKYSIVQLENYGIKTNLESYKLKGKNGNTLIYLEEPTGSSQSLDEMDKMLELYGDSLTEAEIEAYRKSAKTEKSNSHVIIELDRGNNFIRYISKMNSSKLNKDLGEEYRFYNYEIKKE